jgi:acetyl-CoA acetyltransferase
VNVNSSAIGWGIPGMAHACCSRSPPGAARNQRGLATACIGGGQGIAAIVETV